MRSLSPMWKNRLGWLAAFLAALCLYLFENNAGTRVLLAASLLLPACSALALFLPRRPLSLGLTVPGTLARGEAAPCSLTLHNPSALPLPSLRCTVEVRNLLTGQVQTLDVSSSLGGRGTGTIPFTLASAHCGKLAVKAAQVRALDLFGLFARRIPCEDSSTALVPPQVWPIDVSLADTADFLLDSERYSTQKPGYDPSETFRIREYAPGDPIRQIHWKLSQKTDTVLVRDFGLPVVNQLLLLLETTSLPDAAIPPEELDLMLDLLVSLSHSLLSLGIPHTVGWQDRPSGGYEAREVACGDGLDLLQGLLLSNRAGPGEATVAGCYGQGHVQCAYAHVAVISPYLAPDLSLLCHGNRVTALLCGAPPEQGRWENSVHVAAITPANLRGGGLHLEL